MKKFLSQNWIVIFAAIYCLACALPIIRITTNIIDETVYNIYQLPTVNIIQIIIYPAVLLLMFITAKFAKLNSNDANTMFISFANLAFLFFLPRSFKEYDAKMLIGYYLLYILTVIMIAIQLIRLRIRRNIAS